MKNGSATLRDCLHAIQSQTIFNRCEVIVIDSGSEDDSLKIVKSFPFVRLYEIPPGEFNHGLTRNLAVSHAQGEFIMMTVQDAIAEHDNWLEQMLHHFDDDEVVAVVGQQAVPHTRETNPLQWFRPMSSPRVDIVCMSPQVYNSLSGETKDSSIYYDNANTLYRRSKLQEQPFKEAQFGEDMIWMRDAAMKGWKTVYDSGANVWHYHFRKYSYVFYYTFTVLYTKDKIFGFVPEKAPSMQSLGQIVYRSIKFRISPSWFYHNIRILQAERRAFRLYQRLAKKGPDEIEEYYSRAHPSAQIGRQKE